MIWIVILLIACVYAAVGAALRQVLSIADEVREIVGGKPQ